MKNILRPRPFIEMAFIAMAVGVWRKVDAGDPRHIIYAGRMVTIAFVLGLAIEMVESAIALPEMMTGAFKWYLIASVGYFFLIGLPQLLIKSFKK